MKIMRLFHSLFMLLTLVTFSTGFGKTTADLKQNSKPEFITDGVPVVILSSASVVDFDYYFDVRYTDFIVFESATGTLFVIEKSFKPSYFAVITDVGWNSGKRQYKQIHYKEKLLDNYNLRFKGKLLFDDYSVRDNC